MLRPGMWVTDQDGRIGVFNVPSGQSAGQPEFHVADEHGATVLVIPASTRRLSQARADQIPVNRRPTKQVAERFGYR